MGKGQYLSAVSGTNPILTRLSISRWSLEILGYVHERPQVPKLKLRSLKIPASVTARYGYFQAFEDEMGAVFQVFTQGRRVRFQFP